MLPRRTFIGIASLLMWRPGTVRAEAPPLSKLTWYGHSCFLLESASGTRVLMDPVSEAVGYPLPLELRADAVTISHEHDDHANLALIGGRPRVLRGLTSDKKGWVKIQEKVKDLTIRSIGVYHDDARGTKRGLNTIFVFETGGLRIAHLGDLGHLLDDRDLSALGQIDVVLVPAGGATTLDGRTAGRVVDQIRPRLAALPMHHKTSLTKDASLDPIEPFLAGRRHVRREPTNTFVITGLKKRPAAEIVLLSPVPTGP